MDSIPVLFGRFEYAAVLGNTSVIYQDMDCSEAIEGFGDHILNFLDSGNIAGLTVNELKAELLEVVPEGSEDFVNDILSLVIMQNVDVGSIGSRNVKRIRAFVKGVIRGAEDYAVEDRG